MPIERIVQNVANSVYEVAKNRMPDAFKPVQNLIKPVEQSAQKITGVYGEALVNMSNKANLSIAQILSKISGNADEVSFVSIKSKTLLSELLNKSDVSKDLQTKFLQSIPNEHCASIMEIYFSAFEDLKDISGIIQRNKTGADIKTLVKILESETISDEIKAPKQLGIFSNIDFKELEKITESGISLIRPGYSNVDFSDLYYVTNKIQDKETRDFIVKLYNSKLFRDISFQKLLTIIPDDIELSKLDKIDSMIKIEPDSTGWTVGQIYNFLKLPDEKLNIAIKRNLLNHVGGRKERLDLPLVQELINFDDESWQKIVKRSMLADFSNNNNEFQKMYLSLEELKRYVQLSEKEWNNLKSRNILGYLANLKNIGGYYHTQRIFEGNKEEIVAGIARLPDLDYKKMRNVIAAQRGIDVSIAFSSICEKTDKNIFDVNLFNAGKKLHGELDNFYTIEFHELLKNEKGLYNADAERGLWNFIKLLKKDGLAKNYIVELIKPTENPDFDFYPVIQYRLERLNGADYEARIRVYNKIKAMGEKINPWLNIINRTNTKTEKYVQEILDNPSFSMQEKLKKLIHMKYIASEVLDFLTRCDLKKAFVNSEKYYQMMLNDPEKYVNGEFSSIESMKNEIETLLSSYDVVFALAASIFDKEIMGVILRKRLAFLETYLIKLNRFNVQDLNLLSKMINCTNIDGKPLLPAQKIDFLHLLECYKHIGIPLDDIKNMSENGRLDIAKINMDLFRHVMKRSGLTDEQIKTIPPEKLFQWSSKYIVEIVISMQEDKKTFSDFIYGANLEPDFMKYIHNTSNLYGKTNENTKSIFASEGMYYEKWINPSKENEILFVEKDKNQERFSQVLKQITEDIEFLRSTVPRGVIDKQFPKCIKDGRFVIPNDKTSNAVKLMDFVKSLIAQLEPVWRRANGNLRDDNKKHVAQNTLTILDHLNQRISDISNIKTSSFKTDTLDWTIKMWDRNPQKDIFQGNYSTCCIGMGNSNGCYMPHYILNTAYNMIELVDNKTNNVVGNALCYFIKDEKGLPAFVIDNIEINNASKPSEKVQIKLRNAIADYASKVAKEVTGKDNTPIYMSGKYNDVFCDDVLSKEQMISFLGDIDCDEIYMDLFEGTISKNNLSSYLVFSKCLK